jgi:hypothetical protein
LRSAGRMGNCSCLKSSEMSSVWLSVLRVFITRTYTRVVQGTARWVQGRAVWNGKGLRRGMTTESGMNWKGQRNGMTTESATTWVSTGVNRVGRGVIKLAAVWIEWLAVQIDSKQWYKSTRQSR